VPAVPAFSDVALVTRSHSHEDAPAALDATPRTFNVPAPASLATREPSASKPALETEAVALMDMKLANKVPQGADPLVANTAASAAGVSPVVKLAATEASASKPMPQTKETVANKVLQPGDPLVSNTAASTTGVSSAAKLVAIEVLASRPMPQTKGPIANNVSRLIEPLRADAVGSAAGVSSAAKLAAADAPASNPILQVKEFSASKAPRRAEPLVANTVASATGVSPAVKLATIEAPVSKPMLQTRGSAANQLVPVTNIPRIVEAAPANKPAIVAVSARKILTTGNPVRIFNASGKGIEIVSRRLTSLGWTVRQIEGRIQQATMMYYPAKDAAVAKALERTLPFPIRLTLNPGAGIRVVVGRDYLSWKPRSARLAALWRQVTVVASLDKKAGDRSP
jgi:hypothetical protein